jgi:hypothetical protein
MTVASNRFYFIRNPRPNQMPGILGECLRYVKSCCYLVVLERRLPNPELWIPKKLGVETRHAASNCRYPEDSQGLTVRRAVPRLYVRIFGNYKKTVVHSFLNPVHGMASRSKSQTKPDTRVCHSRLIPQHAGPVLTMTDENGLVFKLGHYQASIEQADSRLARVTWRCVPCGRLSRTQEKTS